MNKKLINLYDISKARNFIYGMIIILIVYYHCAISFNSEFLRIIKPYCDFGVDVFFLMSGICLYFSFSKDQKILSFYKRRIIKALPYYLIFYGILVAYFNLIKSYDLKQFFLNYTMLDFWINGLGNLPWFLAAILVLYLLYPFIYFLLFKNYKFKKIWLSVAGICTIIICILLGKYLPYLNIFTYRIPIIAIGCVLGKYVYKKKDLKFYWLVILIGLLIASKIAFLYIPTVKFLRNLYYIPLSILFVIIVSQIFKFNKTYCNVINISLEFIGCYTLQIYLTHEKTEENLFKLLKLININVAFDNFWYQLICIILAVIISILLTYVIKLFGRLVFPKRIKTENN